MPCSNAAKTQNPLKFAGVPQTPEQLNIQSPTAEIRRGKKRKKEEETARKYYGLPYYIGRP